MSSPVIPQPGTTVEETGSQNTNQQGDSQGKPEPSIDIEAVKAQAAREVGALYMGTIGEKEQRIRSLEAQLAQSNNRPAAVVEEVDGAKFLEAPNRHIENIVAKALEKQLAPVQGMFEQFSRRTQFDSLTKQFRGNEAFKNILDNYGDVVENLVANGPVTAQSLHAAITMVPGLIATGQIQPRNNVSFGFGAPAAPNKGQQLPANLPPSSPSAPAPQTREAKPILSDLEKAIAKRMRISEDEFVKLRDADAEVGDWGEAKKNG